MGPKEKKKWADHLGFQAKEILANAETSSTAPQGKKPDRNQRKEPWYTTRQPIVICYPIDLFYIITATNSIIRIALICIPESQ